MKKAFTLVEMIAVLIILGILVLVIIPVMGGLLSDFEEKSNSQIYEQLYKATQLSYAEKRSNNTLVMATFWKSSGTLPVATTIVDFNEDNDLYAKTWSGDLSGFTAGYSWSCTKAGDMVTDGYLKSKVLADVKNRLEVASDEINVLMFGRYNVDNRFIIENKAVYVGTCP